MLTDGLNQLRSLISIQLSIVTLYNHSDAPRGILKNSATCSQTGANLQKGDGNLLQNEYNKVALSVVNSFGFRFPLTYGGSIEKDLSKICPFTSVFEKLLAAMLMPNSRSLSGLQKCPK